MRHSRAAGHQRAEKRSTRVGCSSTDFLKVSSSALPPLFVCLSKLHGEVLSLATRFLIILTSVNQGILLDKIGSLGPVSYI